MAVTVTTSQMLSNGNYATDDFNAGQVVEVHTGHLYVTDRRTTLAIYAPEAWRSAEVKKSEG